MNFWVRICQGYDDNDQNEVKVQDPLRTYHKQGEATTGWAFSNHKYDSFSFLYINIILNGKKR